MIHARLGQASLLLQNASISDVQSIKNTLTHVMFWFKTRCERMIHVCFGNSMLKGTWAPKYIIEGSLEAKLPTIWTDGKAQAPQPARSSDVEKSRREKMQVREKVGKSRNTAKPKTRPKRGLNEA